VWLVLDGYEGTPVVRAALRLASLTFVRPGELRQARWAELSGRPEGRPFPPYWPLA
jgi:integrase